MTRILTIAVLALLTSATLQAQDSRDQSVVEIKIERSLSPDFAGVADLLPAVQADRLILHYILHNDTKSEMAIGRVEISEQVNCRAIVASGPDARLAAGRSTSMVVEVSPEVGGLLSLTVSIMVDDRAYTYPVHGTVSALLHPGHRHRKGHHCSTGAGASWLLVAGAVAILGTLALRRRRA